MEKELTLNLDRQELVLSAHDLIELAISVVKEKHDALIKRKRHMYGPFDGNLESPSKLSDDPSEWLFFATGLKQGLPRDQVKEYENYLTEHDELIKEEAIEIYKNKISEVLTEPRKEFTQPVWNFRAQFISLAVRKLKFSYKDNRNFIKECFSALKLINKYLSYSPAEFDPSDDYPELDVRLEVDFPTFEDFFRVFSATYHDKVLNKVLSSFLYYLRNFIKHTITIELANKLVETQGRMNSVVNTIDDAFEIFEKTKTSFYDPDPKIAVLSAYNVMAKILDIETASCINDNLLELISGFVSHLKGFSPHAANIREMLINELKICLKNPEKTFQTFYRKEAMYVINSMRELFTLYNTIIFVRELENQGKYPCGKNEIEKLKKYLNLVNQIMSFDKELKKGEKIHQKYPIQGPRKYFTFLKLLIRSGFVITSAEEIAISSVFDQFKRYQNSASEDLDCCEYFSFSSRIRDRLPKLGIDYKESSFEYVQVGCRVLGINNNADRYIYDFSSASKLNVDLVKHVKNLKKNLLSEIRWLFNFDLFQVYEINDKDSLNFYVKYILILKDILTLFNTRIFELRDIMLLRANQLGFKEKSLQRLMMFDHHKIDVNQLLNDITDSIRKINSNYLKLKKLELEVTIKIRGLADKLLLYAQMLANLIAKKDEKVVTYRAIYKHLPTLSPPHFARSARGLLQGQGISSSTDKDTQKNKSLPVLVGAWYLAETSRNPATILTSTMLLDIMEFQALNTDHHTHSIENVLWHPNTIGDAHPDGTDLTKLEKDQRAKKYPEEEGWGGKHPMCHNGSYMRDFSQGNQWKIDHHLSVVRQKEVAIIIRWLFFIIKHFFTDLDPQIVTVSERTKEEQLYNSSENKVSYEKFFSYDITRQKYTSPLAKEMLAKLIKPLFELRMSSFNNMIIPPARITHNFPSTNRYSFVRTIHVKEEEGVKSPFDDLKLSLAYNITFVKWRFDPYCEGAHAPSTLMIDD